MLSLGGLSDLSNVEVQFCLENLQHYDVNAVVLHLVKILEKAIAAAFQDKFVLKLYFLKNQRPVNLS